MSGVGNCLFYQNFVGWHDHEAKEIRWLKVVDPTDQKSFATWERAEDWQPGSALAPFLSPVSQEKSPEKTLEKDKPPSPAVGEQTSLFPDLPPADAESGLLNPILLVLGDWLGLRMQCGNRMLVRVKPDGSVSFGRSGPGGVADWRPDQPNKVVMDPELGLNWGLWHGVLSVDKRRIIWVRRLVIWKQVGDDETAERMEVSGWTTKVRRVAGGGPDANKPGAGEDGLDRTISGVGPRVATTNEDRSPNKAKEAVKLSKSIHSPGKVEEEMRDPAGDLPPDGGSDAHAEGGSSGSRAR